jgi:hypothetical protein
MSIRCAYKIYFNHNNSNEGRLSEFIEVRNGERQGCILSIPDPVSANIRQSYENSERIKEKRNTMEHERKARRPGLRG